MLESAKSNPIESIFADSVQCAIVSSREYSCKATTLREVSAVVAQLMQILCIIDFLP